jgi:poly(3-hydroxybutyrate) depolymerase
VRSFSPGVFALVRRSSQSVVGFACALAALAASIAVSAASAEVDRAFNGFWAARTPQEAAKLVPDIVRSGVTFDEASRRLKAGRPYAANVPKGIVRSSYQAGGREFFYAVNVPDSYDPAQRYQVRIQLHGGVSRESNKPRGDGSIGALAGAEQIYILPTAWADAMWWSPAQLENLNTILDTVKRTYNVDENRVVLSGVSDGGTGAFYLAMKATTPFASFLPLNGSMLVLRSEDLAVGDVFPTNLRNKPFFIVNGGRDPLYPTSHVGPYVEHLKAKGVDIVYKPQPSGVHNTAWWPEVKDSFEAFVRGHPRSPLPETLTWETSGTPYDNRAHWLVIDKLGPNSRKDPELSDVNLLTDGGPMLFDNTRPSGRVDLARSGNTVTASARGVAEFTLLLSPDAFDFSKPVKVEANGRVVFNGRVDPSVATLLKWAARDNDRTMLFAAELTVKLPTG